MPMLGHKFYHGTLRRYVILFGNLFNEITVDRYDDQGTRIQLINVPIEYSPKQKFIQRTLGDPDLTREISTVLPRMGFEFTSVSYSPSRKLNSANQFKRGVDTGGTDFASMYAPVPYDINFSLYALARNAEDGAQIVEQIVPFFTPDFTVTMKALPELNLNLDIPIELTSVTLDDSFEGDFESKRVIQWQMDFVVKGYLFGPIQKTKYIENLTVRLNDDSSSNTQPRLVSTTTLSGNSDFGFSLSQIDNDPGD